MKIYGAGIAGLLAGCQFQQARIYEAAPENTQQHKAVLRFRSSAVGDAVGIDFRKVKVHKGLWLDGKAVAPSIQLANWYSRKVIGKLADRSIWNLAPAERFIAPEDFIGQLIDRCHGRIEWNRPITAADIEQEKEPIVSTLPMNIMVKLIQQLDPTGAPSAPPEPFEYAPITVRRWRVPGADVFQSIYFPSLGTNLYRASITGDLLIAEYAGTADDSEDEMFEAFGLVEDDCVPIEKVSQRYGKIAPIDEAWRKRFIFQLTHSYEIFSLGRFATWRNLLLDDVIKDVSVVKKLINTSSYERMRANVK